MPKMVVNSEIGLYIDRKTTIRMERVEKKKKK